MQMILRNVSHAKRLLNQRHAYGEYAAMSCVLTRCFFAVVVDSAPLGCGVLRWQRVDGPECAIDIDAMAF